MSTVIRSIRIRSCSAVATISMMRRSILSQIESHRSFPFWSVGTNADRISAAVIAAVISAALLSCSFLSVSRTLAVMAAMIRIGM